MLGEPKKNGAIPLATLAALRNNIQTLQWQRSEQLHCTAGVLVQTGEPPPCCCAKCGAAMHVRKTLRRTGHTLEHGTFRVWETVYFCSAGCTKENPSPAKRRNQYTKPVAVQALTQRSESLANLLLPRRTVGYDVLTHVGLQRHVHRKQREQICDSLDQQYGISLSTGEISILAHDFLVYLEALHELHAPQLREVLAQDGGYPLHIDATGESGRGTLLVALAGWRGWVLGSWKIDTERADAILPRVRSVAERFGAPCAVMRDFGRAVIEAAYELVEKLDGNIPVLGCHFHYARDVGKDLLTESHDKLRGLFRRFKIRPGLRAIARDLGRQLGMGIETARSNVEDWLADQTTGYQLPSGKAGLATVRTVAQWVLNYQADGKNEGFPFDLPYLDLQHRCRHALHAVEAFLRTSHPDRKVQRALDHLHRIVEPVRSEVPFARTALVLERRARLFNELRQALRLRVKDNANLPSDRAMPDELVELQDIERNIKKLTTSLRKRRPNRGSAQDMRDAIDVVLKHFDRHGPSLFGHIISLPKAIGGGARLVARTNLALEGFFGGMMHEERRRSGRKNLGQDLEHLPGAAPLAHNLTCADYVEIVCGNLDDLPKAFAQLDAADRRFALPVRKRAAPEKIADVPSSSLPPADRAIVRSEKLEERILDAARSRAPHRQPSRKRRCQP